MPQSLPENPYPLNSPHFHSYDHCLRLERSAANVPINKFSLTMCGRILGYMMLEAPTDDGCNNVQREIESCETDDKLCQLARFYTVYLLALFKKEKGGTPASSSSLSRPSFDHTQDVVKHLLEEAPTSETAVKKLALMRDDFRCVVTGAHDFACYRKRCQVDPTFINSVITQYTHVAYIFPDSINQNLAWPDQVSGKKAEFSATTWTVVERFGTVGANAELLNDPDIHRVENVLTMSGSARQAFDTLEFWFEATDAPNTYNIRKTHEMHNGPIYPPLPPQVTLSSTDPSIPLPNPNYLSIHAACAKVAHLSGAREYLETILEEEEETRVLASNGGSADMLSFLLARAAVAGH